MSKLQKIFTVFALFITFIAAPAWAISKDDAKAKGLIGERTNGYLGVVVSQPSNDLTALVAKINKKRQSVYTQGAKKAGVERSVFEIRMGQRLQDRTPKGQYIQLPNGKWRKK
jgi:uncharacterized protein YdbL (DUF1318 family)